MSPDQKRLFDAAYEKACASDDDSKLVGLQNFMLKLLLQADEAEERYINSLHVVPHNANRGGAKMDKTKVYEKGSKILGVGFALSKCDPSRAICFQRRQRVPLKFVEVANNCEHLPTYDDKKIEGCSAGCGHLNVFTACVNQGLPVPPGLHR